MENDSGLNEQEHIEYLLTNDSFISWLLSQDNYVLYDKVVKAGSLKKAYLIDFGLPFNSEIKGL